MSENPRMVSILRLIATAAGLAIILPQAWLVLSEVFIKRAEHLAQWPAGELTPIWFYTRALITVLGFYPAVIVQRYERARSRWIAVCFACLALATAHTPLVFTTEWGLAAFVGFIQQQPYSLPPAHFKA
jgi:hypothetical protein